MSKLALHSASLRAVVTTLLLALAGFGAAPGALAQNSSPPERMSYQGYLADSAGDPLAPDSPKNYDVEFRIWLEESGGTSPLWAEQQTVTVDKGYFSVLLGEGTALSPPGQLDLSTVFAANNGSDRYVEMTVKGIGTGGGNVRILPRLRLLSSPYAFLAQSANKLVSNTGGDLITGNDDTVSVNGVLGANSITATTTITANSIDASSTINANAITAATFTGSGAALTDLNGANLNNGSVDMTKLVAAVQQALCPVGTILPYAGDVAPPGWSLCQGGTFGAAGFPKLYAVIGTRFGIFNGNPRYPDFRGRFLRGRASGSNLDPDRFSRSAMASGGATGDRVGSVQNHALQNHTHSETRYLDQDPKDDLRATPDGDESGKLETVQTGAHTGNRSAETRPVNAYVNYIIKHD